MKCQRCTKEVKCSSHSGNSFKSHGMSRTSEYYAYHGARQRCNNYNHPKYRDYGGRGIKFLFDSFGHLFSELGPKPSPNHSLDRYPNNNGHYEPNNVRWASNAEQRNNCRKKKVPNKRNSLGRYSI